MDDYRIRSYHRAWTPERMLFGFDELKLPRPVPLRFFLYVIPLGILSLLFEHLVGVRSVYGLLPTWLKVLIPVGLASLFTMASVQGRYFHAELWARARSWWMPRWLSSCYWGTDEDGEQVQVGRIRLIGRYCEHNCLPVRRLWRERWLCVRCQRILRDDESVVRE